MADMKGITCCADCAYYNLRKHRCVRAKDEGKPTDHFYADCPLPDVVAMPVNVLISIEQSDGRKEGNCPKCGMKLDNFYNASYCGTCGQAVKWNDKLVTDNPQGNGEHMLNLAFVKDGEVWIRNGSIDGEDDCSLVDFCSRMCAANKDCCYTEVYGQAPYKPDDSLDDIGDLLMDCSAEGCPVGTTYFAMIQAAELRERLQMYEDRGVMANIT